MTDTQANSTIKPRRHPALTVCVLAIIGLLLGTTPGWSSSRCEDWVARGDGILVTPEDVRELAAFYAERNIQTDMRNITDAAIKFNLYAFETDRLELDHLRSTAANEGAPVSRFGLEGLIQKAETYLQWVMDQQTISDLVAESYFRSFPERFVNSDGEALALTDEVRENIRRGIVAARKQQIDQQTYETLKERYNVQLCDEKAENS